MRDVIIVITLLLCLCIMLYLLSKPVRSLVIKHNRNALRQYVNYLRSRITKNGYLRHLERSALNLPLYYINMDKDTNRKEYMENQFKKLGINFQRIVGFYGKAIKNTSSDAIHTAQGVVKFVNEYPKLTKGEIGCLISHLTAIRKAYDDGVEIAMICEDDLSLETLSIVNLDNFIQNAPDDWGILQLWSCVSENAYDEKMDDEKNIIKYGKFSFARRNSKYFTEASCCGCYLINRQGMKDILNVVGTSDVFSIVHTRKNFPERGEADAYIYDLTTTYAILPSIFIIDNSDLESTIHEDHTEYHLNTAKRAYERLIEGVDM